MEAKDESPREMVFPPIFVTRLLEDGEAGHVQTIVVRELLKIPPQDDYMPGVPDVSSD